MPGFSKLNFKLIGHLIGLLFLVNGGFILLSTFVSFAYDDGAGWQMLQSGAVAILLGGVVMVLTRNHR
ncbi:MAG: TrkH family potassium uptake protein, partial [Flavobacteriaceae bacterium]|nr:TrkH family potassium uptake protein [Flavobacteriaceae bacterium]